MRNTLFGIPQPTGRKKLAAAGLCLFGLCALGLFDYSIGYRISLLVFYVLPIASATIFVGPIFATFLAILSIVIWKAGDFMAGMPYPGMGILFWNGTIVLSLFLIVIYLVHALHRTLINLEATVEQRTEALTREMAQRSRLEREIIDLSEQEQQRFGQELHDLVCQELASVAIASHMLTRKLSALGLDEARHALEIAQMVDHALGRARGVARGFFTAGFDSAGLEDSLRETARNTSERNRITCVVRWQENLSIADGEVLIHLFRIAQEALLNAAKHAGASHVEIRLERERKNLQLTIVDNGKGLSFSERNGKGLGLRIMAYRAGLIGGEFKLERPLNGGTRVVCLIPIEKLIRRSPALERP